MLLNLINALGVFLYNFLSLVPSPPHNITACMVILVYNSFTNKYIN